MYRLTADYTITPAQEQAVKDIMGKFNRGIDRQVLLGVTGSGKTFVVANLIRELNRPALVLSPNKSLAAQLYQEFRQFFPRNRVGYFISYYDYYQPEAYLPQKNSYIAKEVQINREIERLRIRAVRDLLESTQSVVVASVSAIYSFGSPADFKARSLRYHKNNPGNREQLVRELVMLGYEREEGLITPGKLRVRMDTVEVFPADQDQPQRVTLAGGRIRALETFDSISGEPVRSHESIRIFPVSTLFQPSDRIRRIIPRIKEELARRIRYFDDRGEPEYAQRLKKRTLYDLDMLEEMGYCPGIENYAMYLSGREFGESPPTLLNFFGNDFLTVIDESHITLPQLRGMFEGDRSRKQTLVKYGFRLPSALENRPLTFTEFNRSIGRTLYVSATPSSEEIDSAGGQVTELLTRPTGLLDPAIEIRRRPSPVRDMVPELDREISQGNRVLITTLTKGAAEKLTEFLAREGYRVSYLHAEVKPLERIRVIQRLREGTADILVGINLLREGLDLPEVSLVIILDADSRGYLRSKTALIQILGRASRNLNGRAILYLHRPAASVTAAVEESRRRRSFQVAYNQSEGIIPRQIRRKGDHYYDDAFTIGGRFTPRLSEYNSREDLQKAIERLTTEMKTMADRLEFNRAIQLREEVRKLKNLFITEYWED